MTQPDVDAAGTILDAAQPAAAPSAPMLTEAPVNPFNRPSKHSKTVQVRIWSAFTFVLCAAMLGLGMYMHPSAKGIGTHADNLHLPPCGFYTVTGIPCPTCGCTTAVTHLAHGNVWQSIKTQPFGAAVGILAVVLAVSSLVGMATGKWYGPNPQTLAFRWRSTTLFICVLLFGGWAYKIYAMAHGW